MEKIILKDVFTEFEIENKNPPSYRTRGFWPKNSKRKVKIKNIFNEQTGKI